MPTRLTQSLLTLSLLLSGAAVADSTLWQDLTDRSATTTHSSTPAFQHRRLRLDETTLQTTLQWQARAEPAAFSLDLPLPDGGYSNVYFHPETVLSDSLQARYPELRTWRLNSDDTGISGGRAEFTALGLHVMLTTEDGDQLFIEPEQHTGEPTARSYHSFSKRQNASYSQRRFSCGAEQADNGFEWQTSAASKPATRRLLAQRAGEEMLTYDIAIAATGEYTEQFGGSPSTAYSAIVTTVNRLNAIFERDLSLKFRLVSDTSVVFTDPDNDPYNNGYAYNMAVQNQAVLDNYIGAGQYDIGHVLGASFSGDGIALVGTLCENGTKGTASSSAQTLLGDSFIVDYVAHEIGHQLGATHTFNGSAGSCGGGGRWASTAYEPGSGNSIMSYAGICGSDDFQQHVNAQFHIQSILQIHNLAFNGSGRSCAASTTVNNQLPTANAGANYTIPARTPFILNGSGSDSDGDKLLYGWDQTNIGGTASLGVDTGSNALIKSNALDSAGLRYVPAMADLLQGIPTATIGESLPRSDRNLNFRLAVRDGKGAVSYDDTRLTVRDTGERFEILAPTTALTAGTHTIRWHVAGTDQEPFNCATVDLAYTNDQGATFINLKRNTPNDGQEDVQLTTAANHIRVKCSNNVFFAMSGTLPYVAVFQNDGGQDSTVSLDDLADTGGGGSLPAGLLGLLSLVWLLRRWEQHNVNN